MEIEFSSKLLPSVLDTWHTLVQQEKTVAGQVTFITTCKLGSYFPNQLEPEYLLILERRLAGEFSQGQI